jgi:hypothetical protein
MIVGMMIEGINLRGIQCHSLLMSQMMIIIAGIILMTIIMTIMMIMKKAKKMTTQMMIIHETAKTIINDATTHHSTPSSLDHSVLLPSPRHNDQAWEDPPTAHGPPTPRDQVVAREVVMEVPPLPALTLANRHRSDVNGGNYYQR